MKSTIDLSTLGKLSTRLFLLYIKYILKTKKNFTLSMSIREAPPGRGYRGSLSAGSAWETPV